MDILGENNEKKRRVAIYIRVSTTEQRIDGYGLEAQEKKLIEYVNNKGANYETKPAWIFRDTHTGSDLNREKLNELREAVKNKKFDAVLVWKIDRLSRSLKHLLAVFEEFEKNEVSFISVQENIDFRGPIGRLIFQVFGAIAQFERELIKGRTQMGRLASAEMGNYTGTSIPYGYRPVANPGGRGKKLEIVPEEKKQVENIFRWYIFDGLGLGEIANKLNEQGVPKSKLAKGGGRVWKEMVIRKIIHNPIYRGEFVANKFDENGVMLPEDKWTIVAIPPCVSELTFQQAQVICKDKTAGNRKEVYLLSGKLRDVSIQPSKSFTGCQRYKGGFSYRRKQFADKSGVHNTVFEIPAQQIEDWIWLKIRLALKEPEVFINNYLSNQYKGNNRAEEAHTRLQKLRADRLTAELAISKVEEAFETGNYSEEKMAEKVRGRNDEITRIDNQIQQIEDELRILGSVNIEVQKLREASAQVNYNLNNLTQRHKKILVDLFIDRVEMSRKRGEGKRWDIWAEIYFRFNPNKFPSTATEGRTSKPQQVNKNAKKIPNEGDSGADERT